MPARSSAAIRDLDVVVVGELNPDILVAGAPAQPAFGQVEAIVEGIALSVGSSSAIFACGAARMGLRVAFVGIVGDDVFGRFMVDALDAAGIDVTECRVDPSRPTGASVVLVRAADRAILTAVGTIDAVRADDVPDELLARARHLHVGSLFLQAGLRSGLASLLARARRAGLTISLDCNWDPSGRWYPLDDVLDLADLFLPNGTEARQLSGCPGDEAAALDLARRPNDPGGPGGPTGWGPPGSGGLIVGLKRGSAGALAVRGDELVSAPALAVRLADTVGAGDSFDAGFVYGFLASWPLEAMLGLAIACGSLSTRLPGGTDGQPTLAEAAAALAAAGRALPDPAPGGAGTLGR